MNPFNDLKSIDDFRRADEEFQLKKQKAAQERTGSKPATLQVSDAIKERLDAGDVEGANRIMQVHRSGAYGVNTYGDPSAQPMQATPPTAPTNNPMQGNQGGLLNLLGNLVSNNVPSNAPTANTATPTNPAPQNVPRTATPTNGVGAALAYNAALKKGGETQAQKDVELNMNPQIAGGEADAKNASELSYAAPITTAKKTAEIDASQVGDLQKKADSANNMGTLTTRARTLLNSGNASGSLGGAALSFGKRMVGTSDQVTQTNTALKNIAANLTGSVPRMEGPQSDADRAYYQEQAGNVGNVMLPTGDRLAALDEIDKLNEKYQNIATPQKNILAEANGKPTQRIDPYKQGEAAFNAKKAGNYKSKYGLE